MSLTRKWKAIIKQLTSPWTRRVPKRTPPRRQLVAEPLEDRWVPAFIMRFEEPGFAAKTIVDNGVGDSSPTVGNIQFIGSYGTFNFNVTAVQSKPLTANAAAGQIDFNTFLMSSTSGGALTVTAADTDFGVPPLNANPLTLTTQIGGTLTAPAGSSVDFQSWANANNTTPLDTAVTIIPIGSVSPGAVGPLTTNAYSATKSTTFERAAGPYSLFVQANVFINGSGSLGFNALTTVTGEPHEQLLPAALGDFVWEDSNANGKQDSGEPGIPNVLVTLTGTDGDGNPVSLTQTTDTNGYYLFSNLAPGTYQVTFPTVPGYTRTVSNVGDDATDSDANTVTGVTGTYTLVAGQTDLTVDAGYYRPAALGDFVWEDSNANGQQDSGEPGIPNVLVTLTGTDGAGNPVSLTQTTDANGYYLFTNLTPGTYQVTFPTVPGYTRTVSNVGGDASDSDASTATGITGTYTLVSGQTDLTVDAGYYRPAALGDFVWEDSNANGQQDSGEPGIPNVLVALIGTDGAGNPVSLTQTTDANGYYLFSDLTPGTYQVTFPTVPGYTRTVSNVGDDATDSDASTTTGVTGTYTLVSGQTDLTVDAGYYRPAALGDFVWEDSNANGKQDSGEPGIPNVLVTLTGTDGAGNPVSLTQTTDANGYYLFTNLTPGTYQVTFPTVPGYTRTVSNVGGDASDSDASTITGVTGTYTLVAGQTDLTVDAGYYRPAALGDFVWEDSNANGQQDSGEPGIPNVLVALTGTDGAGNPVSLTQTTDANGYYLFSDLTPGTYQVTFPTVPGYTRTVSNVGDDATDSDASTTGVTGTYTLVAGQTDLTVDAGYIKLVPNIDIEKKTTGSSNTNSTPVDYDNEDLPSGPGVPVLSPGGSVTWTYKVTNTGNVPFLSSEVVITDDVGTSSTADDLSTSDGEITFLSVEVGDGDNILEPGEVWLYTATGTVENLDGPVGGSLTVAMSGGTSTSGTAGNIRTFSAGGVSVKASGFSRNKSTGAWSSAYLGSYGGGLGVTDTSEGDGSSNSHTVDNIGRDNYVMFTFSESVVVDSAYLGYVVDDSDLSIWIGTLPGAYSSPVALSDSVLASLGFTEVNLTDLTSSRLADLNAGNLAGNVLVIAAWVEDDSPEDEFKIEKLTFKKSASGVYANKGTVTVPGATDSDLSHYKNNPVSPPPVPGIDIEKTTSGSSNTNGTPTDYDNEDTPSGAGVPVLTPGGTVTWTYKVTNTGTVPFTSNQVVIADDAGTTGTTLDDLSTTNGNITFAGVQVGDSDNILEPGEVWLYSATGTVKTLSGGPVGSDITVNLAGSTGTSGSAGNTRTFSSGGVSVKASAFSRDKSTGTWTNAYLGSYGGGLGVTDSIEGDGSSNMHTVDNVGRDNYVMFSFSESVVVDSAYLGYVVGDSDLSVWIGTLPSAYTSTIPLSDSVLASLGFTEVNLTDLTSARMADLNAGNLAGNVLVIAAWTADDSPEDRFKIEKLTFQKVSSGVYSNKGTVTVPGAADSDLSHYKNNAVSPPPTPAVGSISGSKYHDLNANGQRDSGEQGIGGWTIYLDANNNGVKDYGEKSTVTDSAGNYMFNNLAAGTYKVREVMQSGWYASDAPGSNNNGTVVLNAGGAVQGALFGNYRKGSVSGYKFNDKNADGVWDKSGLDDCSSTDNETGIGGWTIFADFDGDGYRDSDEPYAVTASDGSYTIDGIMPGRAFELAEVNQSGWVRTTDDVAMTLQSGQCVTGQKIGNFKGNLVMGGDTATVNWWKGTNGKALIYKLNGGGTTGNKTALGNWLACTFDELYGSGCGTNDLSGKTNAQIYSYLCSLINSSKTLEAQVLATAIAVYATDSDTAGGTYAASYGFTVTTTGVKNDYFNIGDNGSAFGVVNYSLLTVWEILQRTNDRANNGSLWYGYSSTTKAMALEVYAGINSAGGITV